MPALESLISPPFPLRFIPFLPVLSLPFRIGTDLDSPCLRVLAPSGPPYLSAPFAACRAPTLRVILPELNPDFPFLPDLYAPCIALSLTALTLLSCLT